MEMTPEQVDEIAALMDQLETMDPAELPGPAADLVEVLNRILESESDS